jgi:hypothetical protein
MSAFRLRLIPLVVSNAAPVAAAAMTNLMERMSEFLSPMSDESAVPVS